MVRIIVVVGFILALITAAMLGFRWLQLGDDHLAGTDKPDCDLLAGPCEWDTKAGHWQVDLTVLDNHELDAEYQLTVHSPIQPERFLGVLRGESMYMGEYPIPLRQDGEGKYSAFFNAPLCTTGSEMVWRVDLQEGQQPLAEPAPLKLVFQAEMH
ncbi:MAG: hypothetical protein ACTHYN_06865 [Marinobacter sp.]|uniref:hypothetical protein n=1 Tax=Marinobacter sp. TaxID=50741 RepID=UPI003F9CD7A7